MANDDVIKMVNGDEGEKVEGEIEGKKKAKEENVVYTKITKGKRIVVPKEIVEMYEIKNGNMAEWRYDKEGNIRIKIKEIVVREKRPKG